MQFPSRKKILVFPFKQPFLPEHLERAEAYLRQEGFQDIRKEAHSLSAVRGSLWFLVLPFGDPLDYRHRIEISLFEIRYTVELLYTPLPNSEAWFFRQEAQMLQEFVFLEKAGALRESEVRDELAFRIAEKTVQAMMRLLLVLLALLPVLFVAGVVVSLLRLIF